MKKIRERRSEKVHRKVMELTEKVSNFDADLLMATTEIIAKETNLDRSNVSKELNNLFNNKKLVKVVGKPVIYLDKIIIERKLKKTLQKDLYESITQLKEEINKNELSDDVNSIEQASILDTLIGSSESIKLQIDQGKAAILYPPHGLHMLIVGETGVGKSTFAEIMYRYGIESKRFNNESPFIIFNCADYSENPQLLLSQLFGHVKGAFTGAEREKKGLVEQADGGILFLDEIHRLPSEGQEMMFLLMDKGIFRRLGESDNFRNSKVLIMAATTEDPHSTMLHTFLRRIPSVIKLPSLKERSVNERITLIYKFFQQQFLRVMIPIKVSNEVIKALTIYDCPGNIGQLKSDIQLICAKGFLDYISRGKDYIEIKLSQLSESILNGYFNVKDRKKELINLSSKNSIYFDNNKLEWPDELKNIIIDGNEKEDFEDVYEIIERNFSDLSTTELSNKEIRNKINNQIEKYLRRLFNKINSSPNPLKQEAIFTIINPKILTIVDELLEDMKEQIGGTLDVKIKYGLSLHINTLIERLQIGSVISNPNKNEIMQQHPVEYKIAEKLKQKLQERLFISIPEDEIAFLAMFILAIKSGEKDKTVGILVIAHGQSTATSMANVANKLLGVDQARAIDMPLDENIENVLVKAIEEVKNINKGKGVLLLVDMGSLTSFADIISEKTEINVKCLSMVSTLTIIEATRKSLLPDTTLDKLYQELEKITTGTNANDYDIFIEFKDVQIEKALINILEETLSFLNVKKACNLLFKVLKNIITELNQEIDDNIKTKFLFHCCCMIERVIRNDSFINNSINKIVRNKKRYFMLIKKAFECVEETFGINIPDTEIGYVVEILDTHYDTEVDKFISFDTD